VAFLFFVFGTTLGLDAVFPKLKDVNKETLVVFNCENTIFSYLDAVFSERNKDIWAGFNKKRENLNREKNIKIDRALFFAPRRIMGMEYKQNFKDLQDKGANIIFVYQIDKDRMKFSNELSRDIRFSTYNFLNELDLKKDESLKKIQSPKETERFIDFENGLLIANPQNISEDLAKIATEFSKNKSIKKIIVVHDGSLKINKSETKIPTEEIKVQVQEFKPIISEEQINRQLEILLGSGEWMDDSRIQKISNLSDEEVIFEICRQSIMDVCPCKEIIEEEIYEKISNIVKDRDSIKNLEEIIDDFQEVYNSLPNIIHYANRVDLWERCHMLNIEERKAVELLKQVDRLYFNEHEVRDAPYRVLRRLGSGIHCKDIEKYNYVKNFMRTGEKVRKNTDSSRYKIYLKVLEIVFDRVNRDMTSILEELRDKTIKVLIQNKIEEKRIMNVFKISEEKLKNIINVNSLKNEEEIAGNKKKDEKNIKKHLKS
jgi:hypothetical protein